MALVMKDRYKEAKFDVEQWLGLADANSNIRKVMFFRGYIVENNIHTHYVGKMCQNFTYVATKLVSFRVSEGDLLLIH